MDNKGSGETLGVIVTGVLIVLVVAAIVALLGCWVIVPAGYVGVPVTMGNVDQNPFPAGLNFKNPVKGVVFASVQTQSIDMYGPNEAQSKSVEGLDVFINMTTLYHIDQWSADDIYVKLGNDYQNKVVVPEIRGALREEVAKYKAEDLYSKERGEIADAVLKNVNVKLNPRGIYVEDVIIRGVDLDERLKASILEKQAMEQNIQKKDYEVQVAQKEAERKITEAEGTAKANRIVSDSLDDKLIQYHWIDVVGGSDNTIYVPSDGGMPVLTRTV